MKKYDIAIEIVPFKPKAGHLGFASITINKFITINDIAIFSRPGGGIRLGYPIKNLANGTTMNIINIHDSDLERLIEINMQNSYESLIRGSSNA